MTANEPSSCPWWWIPRLPWLDEKIIDTTSKKSTQIIDLPNISVPTYSQYCQLVKEFHSGNENSKLYNQLIRPHFTAISFEWEIQKAHANYFELLKSFLENTIIGESVSKDLKDILFHLNVSSLRESIWKKSPQERYNILNEYLKILPCIYNSARVNILWNVVVFLLWKSSFSISWKTWLYWKNFLKELQDDWENP